ncbi:hypothetical protein ANN_01182 [Periplaneta americana]|uniref:Reverse transcriptase domain-containing protein n=1 Tax=Periplaneta americana TaxID=6978 RepID=A0ABQ8TVC4_PERAM|nr:hypothetical protein ANN_01182 [Periplaneta americana]
MPNRSTVHQLTRIVEYISRGYHLCYSVIAVFFDIEKAYDTVWHKGLLAKLINLKIPSDFISIISSFVSLRIFKFIVRTPFSSVKHIWQVFLKVLSYLQHFIIYCTSDIPRHDFSQLAMYADDTVIYCRKWNMLSTHRVIPQRLHSIDKWTKLWKIKINSTKTSAIVFTKSRAALPSFLFLRNVQIHYVLKTKYLGILLHWRLNWKEHILKNKYAALTRLKQIMLLLLSTVLSLRCNLSLYKLYIRSQMIYAASAWGFTPNTTSHHLQMVHNKAFRIIGGYDFFTKQIQMHDDLEIPTVSEYIRVITKNFYIQTRENENVLISNIGKYNVAMYNKHKTAKHILLNLW